MDAAEHRLKLLLFYYFENTYDELFGKRIHIVVGDVTNAFMGRIKIYNMLGCIPYELYEEQVEFSPINEVAHAIMLLSSTPKQNCLFRVYNSHSQFLSDVLSEFKNINGEFKFVEQDEYKEVLDLAMTDPEKAKKSLESLGISGPCTRQKSGGCDVDKHLHHTGFASSGLQMVSHHMGLYRQDA